MKKGFILLVLFVSVFLFSACQREVEFDFNKGELVVGLECAYAPFNWTEDDPTASNHPIFGTNTYAEGYDIQIAKLVAEELQLTLVIKKMEWGALIENLKEGSIDLIIAGMSPTADRKLSIDFTNPYYESTHVVLIKENSSYVNAKTFADFSGANVVGQQGTVYDDLAKQLSEKGGAIYQNALDTVPLIIFAMQSGAIDATILEEPVAISTVAQHSEFTYVTLETPFEIAEEDRVVSIGVRKVDTALRDAVNSALAKITNEMRTTLMNQAINHSPEGE
jgi:ABC-type amino acid transport substrate-binding protein